jgi:hypothetical protein
MPLADLELSAAPGPVPSDVRAFLREAGRRVEHFQRECRVPGFVASDYAGAYAVLRALAEADLAPGELFCEWGSGLGVVACLAALVGFDAYGIEVEPELVDAARRLAEDFDLPVEFVRGSFLPRGAAARVGGEFAWLSTEEGGAEDELGLAAGDFDVTFAYPWPDEERLTGALFERGAAPGAVLVTYHSAGFFRVRRKRPRR